ncbi:MAG: AAA family ATPase [Parcubacteria group bacterium]|nr:AAA family ATPase [Parcubacteria group bacterium]
MNKTYIKRDFYLNKIIPFIDKDIIKVIIGPRRIGKSYLLKQLIDIIKSDNPKAEVIYINKELADFDFLKNSKDLVEFAEKIFNKNQLKKYLFIDEIQEIKNFEKALRHFQAKGGIDIYCTGSNAFLLSGELATFLSGRYIEIPMYTLSYVEFLKFHDLEDADESLEKYLHFGGFPYLYNLELKDEIVFEYLNNIYKSGYFLMKYGLP